MRIKLVWLVTRDDGNSQEAEESIDSVWLTRVDAERRMVAVDDALFVRIEAHGIGAPRR